MKTNEQLRDIERMVEHEIGVCQTALVEEAIKRELFSLDDVLNFTRPFDGQLLSPTTCRQCQKNFKRLDAETELCEACFDEQPEIQEVYEWWVVTRWFGTKLILAGEPVLKNEYGIWWGRCTSGQSIFLDRCIQGIYEDLTG